MNEEERAVDFIIQDEFDIRKYVDDIPSDNPEALFAGGIIIAMLETKKRHALTDLQRRRDVEARERQLRRRATLGGIIAFVAGWVANTVATRWVANQDDIP